MPAKHTASACRVHGHQEIATQPQAAVVTDEEYLVIARHYFQATNIEEEVFRERALQGKIPKHSRGAAVMTSMSQVRTGAKIVKVNIMYRNQKTHLVN